MQELTKQSDPTTPAGPPAATKDANNDSPQAAAHLAQLEAQLLMQLQQTLASGLDGGSGRLRRDRFDGTPYSAPCSRHASPLKQRGRDGQRLDSQEEVGYDTCLDCC